MLKARKSGIKITVMLMRRLLNNHILMSALFLYW